MPSPKKIGCSLQRRATISSILVSLFSTGGCAISYPKRGLSELKVKRIHYISPRHEPDLELNISPWASDALAANIKSQRDAINAELGSWSDRVVSQFSISLIDSLQRHEFEVDISGNDGTGSQPNIYGASIRSYLTAGFVSRIYTSQTFAPFVEVLLEARSVAAETFYHQLYVATNRPFNLFMNSMPANTNYLLGSIDSLHSEHEAALEALTLLAAQLGEKFAEDLTASL